MKRTFNSVIGKGLTWSGESETEDEKFLVDKLISEEWTLLTVFTKGDNYKVNISDFVSMVKKTIPIQNIMKNEDGNIILMLANINLLRQQKRSIVRSYKKYSKSK